jgi:hypothetical protein
MDAVGTNRRGWLAAVGLTLIAGSVWLAASAGIDSLGISISTALEGSPGAPARDRPSCQDVSGDQHKWHSVELAMSPDSEATTHVGSAKLVASTAKAPTQLHWSSDLGVDAVLLHSRAETKIHRFDSERFFERHEVGDTSELTKVTFCYDLELTVNKDANPALTRVYEWDIRETVEPSQWRLSKDEQGVSTYRVEVSRDSGTDSGWRVTGTITIDNLTPSSAVIDEVVDMTSDGEAAQIDCGVELPGYVLESGASLTCEYQTRLSDNASRSATALVRTSGPVEGASANAHIDFASAQVEEVADSVYVTASTGRSWTFDKSDTITYERTFRCDEDAGLHPSAVRIDGTDLRSSTSVSIDCQPTPTERTAARPSER